MKRLVFLLVAFTLVLNTYGQPDTVKQKKMKNPVVNVKEDASGSEVSVGPNDNIKVQSHPDTTKIMLGRKGISIVDNGDGTSVKVEKIDYDDDDMQNDDFFKSKSKFKGHWAGFEFGFNNFVDNNFSFSRQGENSFMDLNTGRSWNVNINFMQYSIGFGTDKIGLVTGMGLEFNDYHFDNNINIIKDPVTGVIVADQYYNNNDIQLDKTKLTTTYVTVPLLLEFQLLNASRSKRIHLSGGVIGGVKIGSHSKVVYQDNGDKRKQKNRDDFNLSPFRYGVTARVGYRALNLFANYYITPLFEAEKGPELYPVSIGIRFDF